MSAFIQTATKGFFISVARSVSIGALLFSANIVNAQDIILDYSSAWFQPKLIENNSDICESVSKAVFTEVLDPSVGFKPEGLEQIHPDKIIHRGRVWAIEEPIISNEKEIYLYSASTIGCGGACNQLFFSASESPMPPNLDLSSSIDFLRNTAGVGFNSPRLYKNSSSEYFVVTESSERKTVYYLDEQPEWLAVCTVQLGVSKHEFETHPEVQTVARQLDIFRDVLGEIQGGAGSCGSSRSALRAWARLDENLLELLYRPYTGEISDGTETGHGLISLWGKTGIAEQEIIKEYEKQHAITVEVLAEFYQQQFGLDDRDANTIAQNGISRAVSSGFSFAYNYAPFSNPQEEPLRAAILNNEPIGEIRKFQLPAGTINANNKWRDSILNVAVGYPQALEYLLSLGGDPNQTNAFGKTPLMYAAQHNALESAEILVRAGADPNAATTIPSDRCNYTLSTTSMTPLHYAVRYASYELIDFLVLSGANTYTAAFTGHEFDEAEYVIDWLEEYASSNSEEPNPYLIEKDYLELKTKLALPSPEELAKIADDFVFRADTAYQNGDSSQALASLKKALVAGPQHEQALLNVSQIELQLGNLSKAAHAATKLIKHSASNSNLAEAWSNLGSACKVRNYLTYNSVRLCNHSRLFYLLQSWELEPTESRKDKLVSFFEELRDNYGSSAVCEFEPETAHYYYLNNGATPPESQGRSIFYLLHEPGWKPEENILQWKERGGNVWKNPSFAETVDLGDYSISIFSGIDSISEARFPEISCQPSIHSR